MTTWNTLEEVVTLAEESTTPPPPPEGSVPPQKIPGWIRWPIRVFMIPFVLLDLAAQRIARLFFKFPQEEESAKKVNKLNILRENKEID